MPHSPRSTRLSVFLQHNRTESESALSLQLEGERATVRSLQAQLTVLQQAESDVSTALQAEVTRLQSELTAAQHEARSLQAQLDEQDQFSARLLEEGKVRGTRLMYIHAHTSIPSLYLPPVLRNNLRSASTTLGLHNRASVVSTRSLPSRWSPCRPSSPWPGVSRAACVTSSTPSRGRPLPYAR